MNIAYVLTSDIANFRGSTGKIAGQVEAWRELGHAVKVFARTPNLDESPLEAERFLLTGSFVRDNLSRNRPMVSAIESFKPDVVYFRAGIANATYNAVASRFPSVVEINTDDIEETRHLLRTEPSLRAAIRAVYTLFFRGTFLRRLRGAVFITQELRERRRFSKYFAESVVVPNSVKLSEESADILKGTDAFDDPRVHLFFIGSPGFVWHGQDKLERLANQLGDEFFIHIVGLSGKDRANLKYYGYQERSTYEAILRKCHICLGTFALHRKNQDECSTIKFGEYLRAGFPTILPYKETAVIGTGRQGFILQLPNREDLLDVPGVVESIRDFCVRQRLRVVRHQDAAPLIAASTLEKRRLTFLEDVVRNDP